MKDLNKIRVVARTTDPETSHQAAFDFESNQNKAQRSVRIVVDILTDHGPLTDFEIRELWPLYWGKLFSDSLPCKARHWARTAGLVKHDGFSKHNGRKVRRWALGKEELPEIVTCPTCGHKTRKTESKDE